MTNMRRNWWFSLLLGFVYLGIFHLWRILPHLWIVVSGTLTGAFLLLALALAARQKYFLNRWDEIWHFTVILDILLEAFLIRTHDHYGFYFCAAGFALVIGAYRASLLRRNIRSPGHQRGIHSISD